MDELICMLDETLGIWKNPQGYYWVEQFARRRSEGYFQTEQDAIKDCKYLIFKN